MHTLQAQQAAAALKAALLAFYLAVEAPSEPTASGIVVTLTVDDEDAEASFEVYHGNHASSGGSL